MNAEKKQLWIILLIVFIGFMGTAIGYPIFPPLFLYATPQSIIPMDWPESSRNILLGVTLAAYPLGQFIGSPILGSCSDRYGRKRVLIFSLIGSALGYLLSGLSLQWNWLWVLLISRFLTGMMEGNLAIVRAMATELKSINKFKTLGRISGVSAIGYVMGPLLGGFLSDKNLVSWFSFAFPFFLAMLFSIIAVILASLKLSEKSERRYGLEISLGQRINFIKRFQYLIKNNPLLKNLLIVSTIYTFAVDIFYEFSPIYLTGLWTMSPSSIAVFNAVLCLTLAIGAEWLPNLLSRIISMDRLIIIAMFLTTLIFGLLAMCRSISFAFILFALSGLVIAMVTTYMTIQVSYTADKTVQGEVMGTQLSLRMLGDAIICLIGGFLIISSVILPLIICTLVALIAGLIYTALWRKNFIPLR